jgi:hypothetical protein
VVVITRGTDAHRHLPAAVAGRIYRDLHQRFGTPTNLQIASTPDDEEKEIGTGEGEDMIADQNGADSGSSTDSATATTASPTHKLLPETSPNTVRRVIMPINSQSQKADIQRSSTPPKTSITPPTQVETRPRRTQVMQP